MFVVLLFPDSVLLDSDGLLGGKGLNVLVEVLGGLTDFSLGFSEGFSGVVSELGDSDDLGLVVDDGSFHIVDELFAGGLVVLVNLIGVGLLLVEGGGDVLEEEVDLVNTVSGGGGELDH